MTIKSVTVGVGAASCMVYARRLIEKLARHPDGLTLHVIATTTAESVFQDECRQKMSTWAHKHKVDIHDAKDYYVAPASGSSCDDAMIVCPASMGLIARVATGVSSNALERAADVAIKEKRPLIIVFREAPLTPIHLRNLLTLAEMEGVYIVPAAPPFYHRPRNMKELVDRFCARVLDLIGIEDKSLARWDPHRGQKKRIGDRTAHFNRLWTAARRREYGKPLRDIGKDHKSYIQIDRARKMADRLGMAYEDFIRANIDEMREIKRFPLVTQLCTPAAEARALRWIDKGGAKTPTDSPRVADLAQDGRYVTALHSIDDGEYTSADLAYAAKRQMEVFGKHSTAVKNALKKKPAKKKLRRKQ